MQLNLSLHSFLAIMRSVYISTALAGHAVYSASASPLTPRKLQFDDVILVGSDNRMSIMKEAEYNQLQARHELNERFTNTKRELEYGQVEDLIYQFRQTSPRATKPQPEYSPSDVHQRKCLESTETQVINDTNLLDWDTQMSPVVGAQGSKASVSVTKGYTLHTELSIGLEAEGVPIIAPIVNKFLGDIPGINMEEVYHTEQELSITFEVPPGQYGVIVSQPFVRRIEGKVLTGCTDAPVVTPWWSHSYYSKTVGGMNWVDGIIRMCNSSSYPVPYCNGWGEHA